MEEQVGKLKEYLDGSQYTVAVTGAGISYMYGMRRFKHVAGESGWARKVTPNYIKSHPDEVYALWKDAFLDAIFEKGPGPVHQQLAELDRRGKLQGIVTQNLDCLHELAGSENVAAFMGSFADTVCLDCGDRSHDLEVWRHGEMPRCPKCGGYLVPAYFSRFGCRLVSGESETNEFMKKAQDLIARAEVLLVIGTTGFHSDEYLADMSPSVNVIQINPESTLFDRIAVLNLRMDAETVLGQILADEEAQNGGVQDA